MSTDDAVINALEAAVAADPANPALRTHLASLLAMAGDPARALEHARAALAVAPDDAAALAAAREASRLLGAEPLPAQDRAGSDLDVDPEPPPQLTLADVGGLEDVKARLDAAFLAPLRNPELRRFYGKSLRGGLLLYGPPGCGKTFLARAVAGELGAQFFSIGLNDVLDMWLGESERHLHDSFEAARRSAPCVLFLDELDALGQKRSQLRHSGGRNVVNQLLAELDGAQADNDDLFVLAATNHPWDVDTALRRPGRLDRTVLVLPPDAPAREAILRNALAERPVDGADVAKLAQATDGFSGADLAHLVETAAEAALQESLRSGELRPITHAQLEHARRELKPSTRGWFATAYNYALYANDGGEYDDLLAYIRKHRLQ